MQEYKVIIRRLDNTILNLKMNNLELARKTAIRYNQKYGYDTKIYKTEEIFTRTMKRGE